MLPKHWELVPELMPSGSGSPLRFAPSNSPSWRDCLVFLPTSWSAKKRALVVLAQSERCGASLKRRPIFPAVSKRKLSRSWMPSSPSTPTASDVARPAPFRSPENFCRRRSGHRNTSRHRAPPPFRLPVQPFFPRPPRRDPAGGGKRVRLRRSVAKPSAGGARSRRRDQDAQRPGATRAGAEPAFQGTGHGRRPGTLERKARRGRRAEPARSATTAPAPRDRGAVAQGGLDKRGGSADGRGPLWVFGVGGPRPAVTARDTVMEVLPIEPR